MKRTYTVKLPPRIASTVNIIRKLPLNCLYPISYDEIKHMQWVSGNILRQSLTTYDFLMELFEIHLQEDLTIEAIFNKSSVVFYYGFNGDVKGENKENASFFILPAGQYGAVNVPLGRYQLTLARGYTAGFLYIFDDKYLDNVLKMAPPDFRTGSHFRIGSPDCHQFPFFVIDSIGQILSQLRNSNSDQRSLSIKMALFELLRKYGEQLSRYKNRPAGEALKKVTAVRNFIEAQVASSAVLTVSEIGQQFNIHPDALNRSFKNTFGVGLKKYTNQVKMHLAYALLLQRKMSVKEVSEYSQYGSPFSFSIQFKLYYGFSPSRLASINERQ